MTAQKGSAFLLKISDGATPAVYQTVAGLRTTQMSITGDTVVITSKDSGGWRELLSGAGVRSVSVSAAGIFLGSAAETQDPRQCPGRHARRLRAELRGRRQAARQVPDPAARLCRRFQRRAQLRDAARKLGRGGAGMTRHRQSRSAARRRLLVGGAPRLLRPSFTALVAAEEELGPLFALVERAGAGQLRLVRNGGAVLALPGGPRRADPRRGSARRLPNSALPAARSRCARCSARSCRARG